MNANKWIQLNKLMHSIYIFIDMIELIKLLNYKKNKKIKVQMNK